MLSKNELVRGFSKDESIRIKKHLSKLLPYLTPGQFAIAGGIAIRYHLHQAGIPYPTRPFNDLDITAKNVDTVHPDIKNDFLVYHIHQTENGFFYFSFVDKETRTKVDIFNYQKPPEKVIHIPFKNCVVRMVSIEDQLAKTVFDIQRISENTNVDPKQFQDARLLSQIADMKIADGLWKERRNQEYPESITDSIQRAEAIKQEHPEWVKKNPFRKPTPYNCPDCVKSEEFPLDPMDEIYKILGHIE